MNVLVSGASGFVGSALVRALVEQGHTVRRLVRDRARLTTGSFFWDPSAGELDRRSLEGLDVVVHLAGDNIAAGRWTDARKRSIRESRITGTHLLATALAACPQPPRSFLSASAIGFYGDRGADWLTESSAPGVGFLPDVCQEWEAAADPVIAAGIRRVALRFGVILAPDGGALAKMLPPFRLGLGGVIGNGRQFMSWITLKDAVGAILHAIHRTDLQGAVNMVAPEPVSNRDFTRALAGALHRPAFVPLPAFAARLAFGEMADGALLASARVQPERLLATGYHFQHPLLRPALDAML